MKISPEVYCKHAVLFREIGLDMLQRMQFFSGKPARILDLGAGPNVCTSLIHEQYPDAELIGAEEDEAFVRYAKDTTTELQWEHCAYAKLPFPEAHFDLVFANSCLSRQHDLPLVLSEIHRVLKPNGVVMASVFGNETRAGMNVQKNISTFLVSEAAELFIQNGFFDPVLEMDSITLRYSNSNDFYSEMKALRMIPFLNEALQEEIHTAVFDIILVHAFKTPSQMERVLEKSISVETLREMLKVRS